VRVFLQDSETRKGPRGRADLPSLKVMFEMIPHDPRIRSDQLDLEYSFLSRPSYRSKIGGVAALTFIPRLRP
jgi:hypothetical protein